MQTCECGYTSKRLNVVRHMKTCTARPFALRVNELVAENTQLKEKLEQLAQENAILRDKMDECKELKEELKRNAEEIKRWKRTRRPNISAQTKLRLVMRQNNKCNMCDAPLKENHWDVDHVVPWVESLDNSDENLQICCLPCHRTKSTTENKVRKI